MHVCVQVPHRSEKSRESSKEGATGSCELQDVGAGTELRLSARAKCTFNCEALSQPQS